jgi:hypothetical protein
VLQRQLEATQARFGCRATTHRRCAGGGQPAGAIASRIQAEGQLTTSQAIYRQIIGDDPST